MKKEFKSTYFKYIFMIFIIFIDSLMLPLIGNSKLLFGIYIISNMCFLLPICAKCKKEFSLVLAIFMMVFYSYFIEIYIHYLHINIFIEAEYIYMIPLVIAFMKSFKTKDLTKIIIIVAVFFTNFLLSINNVNFLFYIKSLIPIITFILCYFSIKKCKLDNKNIYTFMFLLCAAMTLLQTFVGFNRDTRNGVFGVFGLNAYSFFLICYPIYTLAKYLKKEVKIVNLLISIITTIVILICTENKATIIILFIIIFLITFLSCKISIKKIVLILIIPLVLLLSYKMLIKYYPFFSYLNSYDAVYAYFFKNNDRVNYRYGRFESLAIIYNDLNDIEKLAGSGCGSSTPLDTVFFKELNRENNTPYYIELYGNNHGYQLTTISTVILDWGIIILCVVYSAIILKIIREAKNIISIKSNNNTTNYIKFAVLILLLFYFSYGNILVNYRTMAIIAILLGTNSILIKKGDINEQS